MRARIRRNGLPPGVQGRVLGMQELAIGMTTFFSASTLVVLMLLLATRVPELIRYSGNETSSG